MTLAAIALGIPLIWVFWPYGEHVGTSEPVTFAAVTIELVREVLHDPRGLVPEDAMFPPIVLGLLAPLYPAIAAVLLIFAPDWLASRRRWVWIVVGVAIVIVSALGWLWADFALSVIGFGMPAGPVTYLPFWLLPGIASLAGLAAISVGVAPRSGLTRLILNG